MNEFPHAQLAGQVSQFYRQEYSIRHPAVDLSLIAAHLSVLHGG
jgi:hypothetical protein